MFTHALQLVQFAWSILIQVPTSSMASAGQTETQAPQ
jgi:hypothetical protein